jgi:hypothetical protein
MVEVEAVGFVGHLRPHLEIHNYQLGYQILVL